MGQANGTTTPESTTPREDIDGSYTEDEDDSDESKDDYDFPGLIPLVESYLDAVNVDVTTRCEIDAYLGLVSARASGTLCTAARWTRDFVASHPEYKRDSVVSERIAHDLVGAVVAVCEREAGGNGDHGFRGLGVPGLARLLGGFRGTCDPV